MGCNAPREEASQGYGPVRGRKGAAKGGTIRASPYSAPAPARAPSTGKGGSAKGRASSVDGGQWECPCGFKNRATNDVCGGDGRVGCKKPRPTGRMPSTPRPRGVPSSAGSKGGSKGSKGGGGRSDEWVCGLCNFGNRPGNVVCGGNGPLGCKSWVCKSCGFTNKGEANNQVCGGNGRLGCKAPAPNAAMPREEMRVFEPHPPRQPPPRMGVKQNQVFEKPKGGGKGKHQSAGDWVFVENDKGKGKGKGKQQQKKGGWTCECGFENSPNNDICGGKGPMGCNLPKPEAWECPGCGFKNKHTNQICGGTGPMGCNEPKPDFDLDAN